MSGIYYTAQTVFISIGLDGLCVTIASWQVDRFRNISQSYRNFWTVVTLVGILFCVFIGVVGIFPNPIILSAYILIILQINKLFNRYNHRDYLQIYILSFLMLTLGTILNTDISYAICFVFYVVFVTWTLMLFHLRKEIEGTYLMRHSQDLEAGEQVEVSHILYSRRLVSNSFLVATSIIALVIFALSSLIFFLFPRIGFGLFFQRQRVGQQLSGFSNKVELGSVGKIQLNRNVVLRIELPDQKQPQPELAQYWRGSAYDFYDGLAWSNRLQHQRTAHFSSPDIHRLHQIDPSHKSQMVRQEIYQEPMDIPMLFGMERVYHLQIPINLTNRIRKLIPAIHHDIYSGAISHRDMMNPDSSLRYTVWSIPQNYTPLPHPLNKRIFERYLRRAYLQLPHNLDPRVRELTLSIVKNAKNTLEKVQFVEQYLRQNYSYSLERSAYQGSPLSDFLFVQKRGHCEYYSTAMAIMLRSIGIPTRNVAGFYGGTWNKYGNYYVVRQSDAHSWVEVYFANKGWMRFEPSPQTGIVRRDNIWRKLEEYVDAIRLRWYKWIIEYDLEHQIKAIRFLREKMSDASRQFQSFSLAQWWRDLRQQVTAYRIGLAMALFVLVLGILALWYRRRSRQYFAKLNEVAATRIYRKALATLRKKGIDRRPNETPLEFAQRSSILAPAVADVVQDMTRQYLELRYNPHHQHNSIKLAHLKSALIELKRLIKQ
jgi:transglutaminase-like putative cysteine protease